MNRSAWTKKSRLRSASRPRALSPWAITMLPPKLDQRLDPSVEGRGVEVLAGDELEPGRSERPLVDAHRGRARVGQELHPVDRVRRHRLEQHVPARDVQAAGQGVEDVDRAHGLRRAAVLLESAPRVEGDRPGLPERPRGGDDVGSRHSRDLLGHVGRELGAARREQVPDGSAVDFVGRVGPVADEVGVVPAVLDHHVGEGQRECRVGAGPDPQPVVGLGGEARLARVDDDQLRAARDRGDGARRVGEAGHGRVVPPEQDAAGVLEIRQVDAGHGGAERVERGEVAAPPAQLHVVAVVRAAERTDQPLHPVDGVADRRRRGRARAEPHRLGPVRGGGGQSRSATVSSASSQVMRSHPGSADTLGPRPPQRVEQPRRVVDDLGRRLALDAEGLAGRVGRIGVQRQERPVATSARAPQRDTHSGQYVGTGSPPITRFSRARARFRQRRRPAPPQGHRPPDC